MTSPFELLRNDRRWYAVGTRLVRRWYAPFVASRAVLVSFVLRLRQEDLVKGQLVGELEAVSSGERRAIRSIDDMTAFCTEMGQVIEHRSI